MAAGILARRIVDREGVSRRAKVLRLRSRGEEKDLALIDAVVVTGSFIGARALWETQKIRQIILTQAEPGSIGMSAIGAALSPTGRKDPFGLFIELGPGGQAVRAPIAPGLIQEVPIHRWRFLKAGETIGLSHPSSILALDGERELELDSRESYELTLDPDGPRVVDVEETLRQAIASGFFRKMI